jgi:predicted nucleic acid-binding protein
MTAATLRRKYALLDANLLVFLCVGRISPTLIGQHKRLQSFDASDIGLLEDVLNQARGIASIPNVVTETSNLARQIGSAFYLPLANSLHTLVNHAIELFVESPAAARHPLHERLGITDAAILLALQQRNDFVLVTVDHNLHVAALEQNSRAVNFNHIRNQRKDFQT